MNQRQRLKTLLALAWPLIIANSFWNLQLTIDRVFLGSFSTEALGAAMAVMGAFWVPMAILQQTSGYITAFAAQYFGANKFDRIGACFWQSVYVSLCGGILFLSLRFISEDFYRWIGHSESLQLLEIEYFNSLTFAALPMALIAAISGLFTGIGKTKIVIGINLVGLLLNVVFDYLFIFGNFGCPRLGIEGAGYATALSSFGGVAYGSILIVKSGGRDQFAIRQSWRFDRTLTKLFLKFGLPSGLQWAFEGLAFTTFLTIMGNLENGSATLASSSIAVTVMMLSVLPTIGVAQGVLTLVGQNLGQKRPLVAKRIAWDGVLVSSVYMACVALSFWLFPTFYLQLFENKHDLHLWNQVQRIAPVLLKFVAVFTVFDAIYLNISFALKGAGDTRFVSLVALIVPWPLMVLPTLYFREQADAVYIAWGFAALYVITTAGLVGLRFRSGKWMSMSIIDEKAP